MKLCLVRTDNKFRKVMQDNFEECFDINFKSEKAEIHFDNAKFEKGGALWTSFWHIFIAGIKYGHSLAKRK